jgi:excisionase family DNA binding protein
MELLKGKDIASILNLSTETVLKLARENHLPHFRLGKGSVRFKQEEVEAWIENARRGEQPKSRETIDPRQMEFPFVQEASPV